MSNECLRWFESARCVIGTFTICTHTHSVIIIDESLTTNRKGVFYLFAERH